MLDNIWKLFRKNLNSTFYSSLKKNLGREKQWMTLNTYEKIFNKYSEVIQCDFKQKKIVEFGCGKQFFTSFFFLNKGAQDVLLIEPAWAIDEDFNQILKSQHAEYFDQYGGLPLNKVKPHIQIVRSAKEIVEQFQNQYHYSFSHLVLEHVSSLEEFYEYQSQLLLPNGGYSWNLVDLSDHTYHVFDKFNFTRPILMNNLLKHLKYSKAKWAKYNDPKCFMNRFLLPYYKEVAAKYPLDAKFSHLGHYPPIKIHSDLIQSELKADDYFISGFVLELTRPQPNQ